MSVIYVTWELGLLSQPFRLNFEDKVISNTAEIKSNASQVEDNISEEQEGTSSETSQKRDDQSSEIQPQSKKSFSELYLETVNRKSKCR